MPFPVAVPHFITAALSFSLFSLYFLSLSLSLSLSCPFFLFVSHTVPVRGGVALRDAGYSVSYFRTSLSTALFQTTRCQHMRHPPSLGLHVPEASPLYDINRSKYNIPATFHSKAYI